MANQIIRWGIMGAGNIAVQFAEDLPFSEGSELLAVASKTPGKASSFVSACPFPSAKAYESYEALLALPDLDVVYIASINTRHCEDTLLALEHGKNVLVEKPFAINAKEAEKMIRKAREKKLFLMEAMWTRFNPVNLQVRSLINSGRIGSVQRIEASFGYFGGEDITQRHLNRELAGGALLDVGIYPLSYSSFLLGKVPTYKQSQAVLDSRTGVDRQFVGLGSCENDSLVVSSASVISQLETAARIYGTSGVIHVPIFYNPREARFFKYGKDQESELLLVDVLKHEEQANGYQFEIRAVNECLRQGKLESVMMPLDESLLILRQMDAMRASWGLKYPQEDQAF